MQATRISSPSISLFEGGVNQLDPKPSQVSQLPARRLVLPAEFADSPQLDQIFSEKSIDHFISMRLRPDISDTDLLTPARFRSILVSLRSSLRAKARNHPKAARQLGRLAAILDEESNLSELLQMYRSALLQG